MFSIRNANVHIFSTGNSSIHAPLDRQDNDTLLTLGRGTSHGDCLLYKQRTNWIFLRV